ncbi:MAG: hypothetical protein K1X89_11890 [Myxococcaceae bacterium]|nr:hypothetical protein [Myxococcaceae bacterium]
MTTTLRMTRTPEALPAWFPPRDPARPADYVLRHVELEMLVTALIGLGVVATSDQRDPALLSREDFWEVGHQFTTGQCTAIARAMRVFVEEPPSADLVNVLRDQWNDTQERFRREVAARGEVVVSGLEPFPYDAAELKNALLHFGGYHAIAAAHGGCAVVA